MIIKKDIIEVQENNFKDYAKEVNLNRSIPDIRDGLKVIQRRIIYTMKEQGYNSNKNYIKSARVAGNTMEIHPHSDSSIYDTMVGMARGYTNNVALLDPHGNFGNIYGSKQAASRYTEIRLNKFTEDVLLDGLKKDIVKFIPSFDNSTLEPTVLPAKIPIVLINGTFGIGVGVTSAIPPHDPKDILNICLKYLNNKDITNEELIKDLYPSFPKGSVICNKNDMKKLYTEGNTSIVLQCKFTYNSKNNTLIMTEIPYMSNFESILDSIKIAINENNITGIRNITNESSNNDIKVVLHLKNKEDHNLILNQLYSFTQCQTTLPANLVATEKDTLVEFKNIKEILDSFFEFRTYTIKKEKIFLINKLSVDKLIQEGLLVALDPKNIDIFIKTVKESISKQDAIINIMNKFKLIKTQAEYLAGIEVHRLNKMEINSIKEKIKLLEDSINKEKVYLEYPEKINNIIKQQIEEINNKFFKKYKNITEVKNISTNKDVSKLIQEEPVMLMLSNNGYIKSIDLPDQVQKKARFGKTLTKFKENDYCIKLFETNSVKNILFFDNQGIVYNEKCYNIPKNKMIKLNSIIKNKNKIISIIPIDDNVIGNTDYSLLVTTFNGKIKRINFTEFSRINNIMYSKVNEDDKILDVELIDNNKLNQSVFVIDSKGYSIRMNINDIPEVKRPTFGVNIFSSKKKSNIVSSTLIDENDNEVAIFTNTGLGKRVSLKEFPIQNRGGIGRIATKLNGDSLVIKSIPINSNVENISTLITTDGKSVLENLERLSLVKRPTFGRTVIKLKDETNKLSDILLLK